MKKFDRQTQAFAMSALLTAGLLGLGFFLWRDQLSTLLPRNQGKPATVVTDYGPNAEQVSEFSLYFVRTLPLYDQQAMPEIIPVSNDDLGQGLRKLVYRVESIPIAEVALMIQDWYVVDHQVVIRTPDGKLMITSPEPNQIVRGSAPLIIKGRSQSETVELVLRDDISGNVLDQISTAVMDQEFSAAFSLSSVDARAVTVEVSSGGDLLSLPLIVDTYVE